MSTIVKTIILDGKEDRLVSSIEGICINMQAAEYKLASSFIYGGYLVLIFQRT